MTKTLFLAGLGVLLILSGCSSTQKAYQQNIRLFFDSKVNVQLSDEEIREIGVDLIYVRNGERPAATMALGFIEHGRYKWLSADGAMLITEAGRIVETLGLENNLLHVSNLADDPIKAKHRQGTLAQWQRLTDADPHQFGLATSSSFRLYENENIEIHGHTFSTQYLLENVSIDSPSEGVVNWQNHYWFDPASGALLKSSQRPADSLERIEITYISRALRMVE